MLLNTLALAGALGIASASPILEPGLKVDCISSEVTGTLAEFSNAYEDFCDTFTQQLQTGEIYTTGDKYCTDERCVVLYLAFTGRDRSGSSTNGSLSYQECTSCFAVRPYPYDTLIPYCASGWYGGSVDGKGSWSTEIIITTPDKYSVRPKTLLPAFENAPGVSTSRRELRDACVTCSSDSDLMTRASR